MMQSGYTVKRYSELPKTITLTRRSHFSIEVLPIAHVYIIYIYIVIYLFIYLYMCVCACVCVYLSVRTLFQVNVQRTYIGRHGFYHRQAPARQMGWRRSRWLRTT